MVRVQVSRPRPPNRRFELCCCALGKGSSEEEPTAGEEDSMVQYIESDTAVPLFIYLLPIGGGESHSSITGAVLADLEILRARNSFKRHDHPTTVLTIRHKFMIRPTKHGYVTDNPSSAFFNKDTCAIPGE